MMRSTGNLMRTLIVLPCLPASAAGDTGAGLAEALKQHYRLAAVRLGVNGESGVEPGSILTVRKSGIVSFGEKDASYAALCPSELERGVVRTPRNPACASLAPASRRLLKVNDRVCVTAIDVAESQGTVTFFLVTCNPSDLAHRTVAGRAVVVFHLDVGKVSAARTEELIGETLSEDEPQSAVAPKTAAAAPPPPLAPDAAPAAGAAEPPDFPTAPNPDTEGQAVAVGQSADQVQAILGPPDLIADLGAKTIYLYPTLKIFFENGKVSRIQQL